MRTPIELEVGEHDAAVGFRALENRRHAGARAPDNDLAIVRVLRRVLLAVRGDHDLTRVDAGLEQLVAHRFRAIEREANVERRAAAAIRVTVEDEQAVGVFLSPRGDVTDLSRAGLVRPNHEARRAANERERRELTDSRVLGLCKRRCPDEHTCDEDDNRGEEGLHSLGYSKPRACLNGLLPDGELRTAPVMRTVSVMFPSLKSWRLGRVLGFPIDLNPSFLLLLAVVFIAFGGLIGVLVVSIAFASVLLHELGHAVVARHVGVEILGIELGFLGGAAKMSGMPRKANHEIAIAAAGPAVSLALAGLGLALGALVGSELISTIGWINLVLAGFNLIPALPMDGGRILRAALTHKFSYVRATEMSVKVARIAAVAFGIMGLSGGSYQLLILAPFLWIMGTRELQMARMVQDHMGGYPDDPDREIQVMSHAAWEREQQARGVPDVGLGGGLRRYTIRQVGGRIVIEAID